MIGSLACCASPAAAVAHNCATNIGAAQATPSRLSYSQNMRPPAPAAPPRRGQNSSSPVNIATTRRRARPHRASTPPQHGHRSSPPASCRSTTSPSPFTVSTTPPRHPGGPPRSFAKRSRGGPRLIRLAHLGTAPGRIRNTSDADPLQHRHRPGAAAHQDTPSRQPPTPIGIPNAATTPGHRNPERRLTPPHQGRHLRRGMDADPDRRAGPRHPRAGRRERGRHYRP